MKVVRRVLCVLTLLFVEVSFSQNEGPMRIALCDVYRNPEQFAGHLIEVRATIVGYQDPSIELPAFAPQEPCPAYLDIALEFPENVKPRPTFDLQGDASFAKYQDALKKGMRIEATLTGRLDVKFIWRDRKRVRVAEGPGFGNKQSSSARLVLYRMSAVDTWPMPRR